MADITLPGSDAVCVSLNALPFTEQPVERARSRSALLHLEGFSTIGGEGGGVGVGEEGEGQERLVEYPGDLGVPWGARRLRGPRCGWHQHHRVSCGLASRFELAASRVLPLRCLHVPMRSTR